MRVYKKWYKIMMKIIIHRGTRQIGGCVTEIRTDDARLFIDIGANLPGMGTELPPIDGLTTGDGANSVLFLTHYHGDHIGLLDRILPEVLVYMGRVARAIQMNYIERVSPDKLPMFEKIRTIEPFENVQFNDVDILPLPCDHSAFGAYMFIIEVGGRRILHTGDFRLHGIIGKHLLNRFLP
jgi:ribonuclease J